QSSGSSLRPSRPSPSSSPSFLAPVIGCRRSHYYEKRLHVNKKPLLVAVWYDPGDAQAARRRDPRLPPRAWREGRHEGRTQGREDGGRAVTSDEGGQGEYGEAVEAHQELTTMRRVGLALNVAGTLGVGLIPYFGMAAGYGGPIVFKSPLWAWGWVLSWLVFVT